MTDTEAIVESKTEITKNESYLFPKSIFGKEDKTKDYTAKFNLFLGLRNGNTWEGIRNIIAKTSNHEFTAEEVQEHYHTVFIDGPLSRLKSDREKFFPYLEFKVPFDKASDFSTTSDSEALLDVQNGQFEEIGYNPYREEFREEFDAEAENIIQSLSCVSDSDADAEDYHLTCIRHYCDRLFMRSEIKDFLKRHRLPEQYFRTGKSKLKYNQMRKQKKSFIIREDFYEHKKWMRFRYLFPKSENYYHSFLSKFLNERGLKNKIKELNKTLRSKKTKAAVEYLKSGMIDQQRYASKKIMSDKSLVKRSKKSKTEGPLSGLHVKLLETKEQIEHSQQDLIGKPEMKEKKKKVCKRSRYYQMRKRYKKLLQSHVIEKEINVESQSKQLNRTYIKKSSCKKGKEHKIQKEGNVKSDKDKFPNKDIKKLKNRNREKRATLLKVGKAKKEMNFKSQNKELPNTCIKKLNNKKGKEYKKQLETGKIAKERNVESQSKQLNKTDMKKLKSKKRKEHKKQLKADTIQNEIIAKSEKDKFPDKNFKKLKNIKEEAHKTLLEADKVEKEIDFKSQNKKLHKTCIKKGKGHKKRLKTGKIEKGINVKSENKELNIEVGKKLRNKLSAKHQKEEKQIYEHDQQLPPVTIGRKYEVINEGDKKLRNKLSAKHQKEKQIYEHDQQLLPVTIGTKYEVIKESGKKLRIKLSAKYQKKKQIYEHDQQLPPVTIVTKYEVIKKGGKKLRNKLSAKHPKEKQIYKHNQQLPPVTIGTKCKLIKEGGKKLRNKLSVKHQKEEKQIYEHDQQLPPVTLARKYQVIKEGGKKLRNKVSAKHQKEENQIYEYDQQFSSVSQVRKYKASYESNKSKIYLRKKLKIKRLKVEKSKEQNSEQFGKNSGRHLRKKKFRKEFNELLEKKLKSGKVKKELNNKPRVKKRTGQRKMHRVEEDLNIQPQLKRRKKRKAEEDLCERREVKKRKVDKAVRDVLNNLIHATAIMCDELLEENLASGKRKNKLNNKPRVKNRTGQRKTHRVEDLNFQSQLKRRKKRKAEQDLCEGREIKERKVDQAARDILNNLIPATAIVCDELLEKNLKPDEVKKELNNKLQVKKTTGHRKMHRVEEDLNFQPQLKRRKKRKAEQDLCEGREVKKRKVDKAVRDVLNNLIHATAIVCDELSEENLTAGKRKKKLNNKPRVKKRTGQRKTHGVEGLNFQPQLKRRKKKKAEQDLCEGREIKERKVDKAVRDVLNNLIDTTAKKLTMEEFEESKREESQITAEIKSPPISDVTPSLLDGQDERHKRKLRANYRNVFKMLSEAESDASSGEEIYRHVPLVDEIDVSTYGFEKTKPKFSIITAEGYDMLSQEEKELCYNLSLLPMFYMAYKIILIAADAERMMGSRMQPSSLFPADIPKHYCIRILNFLKASGWIKSEELVEEAQYYGALLPGLPETLA